jgi:PHD/YefM family antitoxin component YafN of YafNO toxin-antitoxin module
MPAAALISLQDFACREATAHLWKPPGNVARLRAAIAELEADEGTERKLCE